MACGRYSPEYSPSNVSAMGDRAYARPATARVHGVPMPSRPASRAVPVKAAMSTALIHSRCTIQGGTAASLPSAKNGPIGNR